MEQQTLSVAKAGLVCKLNTRTTIIAATNTKVDLIIQRDNIQHQTDRIQKYKGNFDAGQPISVNTALGSPLLSRFDLIFLLLDEKDSKWDKTVAHFILNGNTDETKENNRVIEIDSNVWSLEKLQVCCKIRSNLQFTYFSSKKKKKKSELCKYCKENRTSFEL